ncbi:MAG: cyclic nucleotide-binding domain-containing protein [Azovibrio sp.]|uniref:cyclic nucleotide-binding domain-containing protein n=1 Tax=Azovibrio sp. TaxID=1872673 RepID=UPI003C74AD9D
MAQQELLPYLRKLQPLARLDAEHLAALLENCHVRCMPRGERAEAPVPGGSGLLYLASGELCLTYPGGTREVLVGGCAKGCWPLGQAGPYPVRLQAITDTLMIQVDGLALDQLLTWGQALHGAGWQTGPWQAHAGHLPAALLTRGAFSHLPAAHIGALLACFEPLEVPEETRVVQEGEAGDAYYLIESGRVQVVRRVGGADLLVAELGPGQAFGEEALVSGEVRNATVRMKTAGRLLRLAKPDFIRLLKAPLLKSVTFPEARQLIEAGGRWLDVRYPAEYTLDGLPGALNMPLDEIRNAFTLLPREQTYITYCRSGRRSATAAFLLAQQGFDARWLEGGLPQTAPDPWIRKPE